MLRSLLSLRRPTHDYCSWMQTIPPPSAPTLAPAVRNRQIAVAMDPLSLSHSLFLSPGIYSLALQPSTALLNPSSSATAHVSLSHFLLVGPPPATLPGFCRQIRCSRRRIRITRLLPAYLLPRTEYYSHHTKKIWVLAIIGLVSKSVV